MNGPPASPPLLVGLAIDHQLVREGLILLLEDTWPVEVVVASSAASLAHNGRLDVAVVLVDGDVASFIADITALRQALPDTRIVGLHDELPPADFQAALASGISVLVDLASGFDAVVEAIVGTRERSLRRWAPPRLGAVALTKREREVLESIAAGHTSAETAAALSITSYTVEHHKSRLFRKLSASSQSQAVAIAIRGGLIGGDASVDPNPSEQPQTIENDISAVVIGTPTVLLRVVSRVLESGGIKVIPSDLASSDSVAVVVDPTLDDWATVAATDLPTVVLTAPEPDRDTLLGLVTRGAQAVLPTDSEPAHLVATVVQVARGETGLTRIQTRQLVDALKGRSLPTSAREATLTARELETLQMLDRGVSVKQASLELQVSPRTVENTRRVLYRKLGVRNRAEAIAAAYARGFLRAD